MTFVVLNLGDPLPLLLQDPERGEFTFGFPGGWSFDQNIVANLNSLSYPAHDLILNALFIFSKRAVATVELEAEAGLEIQQILFNKAKSKSSVQVSSAADLILTTPKPSSTGPYPFRPTKHNYPPHSPFNEDAASAETQNACDDLSG